MDRAAQICARLIREGAVKREEVPELDVPDVRREVERRLAETGLELATSAYSEHVGIRLSPEVTSEAAFDAASNMGLRADACALLVLLWARLVLQKRTARDTRAVPGQAELLAADSAKAARQYNPPVRFETLMREFSHVVGSRTNLRRLLTQLKRLGFVAVRGDLVEAGPMLELGIDGERMVAFIRRGVLARLLEEREGAAGQEEAAAAPDPADEIAAALKRLGGSAPMRRIEQETGRGRTALQRLLRRLEESGRVRRTGERFSTIYHLVESP